MPQIVTGAVAPVPGLPGVPIGVELDSAPSHVPVESPSSAAATAQTVTGADTGAEPVAAVPTWEGSHELLAVPSTATTTLHALTGMTPSTGALWLPSLVGRSLTSGNPGVGHAHAVGRAIGLHDHTTGRHRHEGIRRLSLLGRGVGLLWQSAELFRRSPQ